MIVAGHHFSRPAGVAFLVCLFILGSLIRHAVRSPDRSCDCAGTRHMNGIEYRYSC